MGARADGFICHDGYGVLLLTARTWLGLVRHQLRALLLAHKLGTLLVAHQLPALLVGLGRRRLLMGSLRRRGSQPFRGKQHRLAGRGD